MSVIRTIAPPSLPVPPPEYDVGSQNLFNAAVQQFGARTANAVNQILNNTTPESLPYIQQFSSPSGLNVIYRVNLSGDLTLNAPTGAADGDLISYWFYAGNKSSRTVTLGSGIVVPSTITGASPLTIALNKKAVYTIRYDNLLNKGQWELVSFQNGY
jgi:hypothetical protein